MNKAFIVSTDKGEVKDFVGEVLRYVEEQKNWSRGQARQYIGWSDMVQGETAIVAQPGKIDSTLFKDALKFAKTETKTDYKMARPDNYIGEKLREYRGPRVTVHDEDRKHEIVVSLYELANAKWSKLSEEGGLSEIAANVKDVDGRDIKFAFVDEEPSEYIEVILKSGDWIVGKVVDIDYPDYDDIRYASDLRKVLDLEFDYSGRKSEHYRKERAHVVVSHILLDTGWMPASLSANQQRIFDNAERKVYDYFVANDTDEISNDLYNEIYYGFRSKKFDESVSRRGKMLKESEENYYAVENVRVEVFGVADEVFDTDPQSGDLTFSGYYKNDDELIKRVGEAFGIMNLQDFSKEHYNDEHRIIVSSFMANGIDEENPFDFSNATLDDVHGDYEVVITITYDGGEMNEDVDEDDVETYVIPEWTLPYLINNDPSGLNDDEIEEIDKFRESLPSNFFSVEETEDGNVETFFTRTNDLPGKHGQLGNICVTLLVARK